MMHSTTTPHKRHPQHHPPPPPPQQPSVYTPSSQQLRASASAAIANSSSREDVRKLRRELKAAREAALAANAQLTKSQNLIGKYRQTIIGMQKAQAEREVQLKEQVQVALEARVAEVEASIREDVANDLKEQLRHAHATGGSASPWWPEKKSGKKRTKGGEPSSQRQRRGRSADTPRSSRGDHEEEGSDSPWVRTPAWTAVAPPLQTTTPRGVSSVHVQEPPENGAAFASELVMLEEEMRSLHQAIDVTASKLAL